MPSLYTPPPRAGPAAAAVCLILDEGAGAHRGRGREDVGAAAAQGAAAAASLGLIVVDQAVADGNDTSAKLAKDGGVVVAQPIEDGAARAETGEDRAAAVGRVVVAAAGLVVVQVAVAYAGRTSQVIHNARAGRRPRPDPSP